MTIVHARSVLLPGGIGGPHRVVVEDDHIVAIEPTTRHDVELLTPGFVDIQVNGIGPDDVAVADDGAWARLDRALLEQGTTSWCPTLVTAALSDYEPRLARIRRAMERPPTGRPTIIGAHLEGPFLGGAPGAHPRAHVVPVDLDWVASLPSHVALVTIAPESPGAVEAVRRLVQRGVLVSIGHTTASTDEVDAVVHAGARMATHLFNGMTPFHHRSPGVAGRILAHPTLSASLIADGEHLHGDTLRLCFAVLGESRTVLVTDAVAAPSDPEGRPPRLDDGTLAGTRLTMPTALRTCVAVGVDLVDALYAASRNPSRLLGLADRGEIEVGRRADLVALDSRLEVRQVWVAGVATL